MAEEIPALKARVDDLVSFLHRPCQTPRRSRAHSDSRSCSEGDSRRVHRRRSKHIVLRSRSPDNPGERRSRSRRKRHKQRSMLQGFVPPELCGGYFMTPFAFPPCAAYFNPLVQPSRLPAARPSEAPNVGRSSGHASVAEARPAKTELQEVTAPLLLDATLPTPSSSSTGSSVSRSRRKNRWDDNSTEVILAKYVPDGETGGADLPLPIRVLVQGNGLGDERRFRATYTRDWARSDSVDWDRSTVVGPWNKIREDAIADADRLKAAHTRGGFIEMTFEAVALHRQAVCAALPDDVHSWELQEKALQAGQFQHRCSCRVDRLTRDGAHFQSPWRASRDRAEEDLWSLFDSYRSGGLANVQRIVKNQTSAMRLPGLL